MKKTNFKCKVCEKEVETTERHFLRSASMKMMCCSLRCLKSTSEYREKRKQADEIRVRKIKDSEGFSVNGTKSKITRAKNFLTLHGISHENLNDEQLIEIWKKEHREKSGHIQKIRSGRLEKYGSAEAIKAADKRRIVKASCKRLGIPYHEDFSEDEIKSITREAFANFKVKDTTAWKLKHILKHRQIDDASLLNNERIDELYSEYVSYRFKRSSIETDKNGYTRSEKGWYEMSSQHFEKFFYRSSWEKKVFEALDYLVGMKAISYVCAPERIDYVLDGVRRYYYPDAAFVRLDGENIVLEVKPSRKVDEPGNVVKIHAAKNKLGKNFHVLTEAEIFGNELLEILEKL